MADGARTRDNRNHNPGLYQLSYSHHRDAGAPISETNDERKAERIIEFDAINASPSKQQQADPQKIALY